MLIGLWKQELVFIISSLFALKLNLLINAANYIMHLYNTETFVRFLQYENINLWFWKWSDLWYLCSPLPLQRRKSWVSGQGFIFIFCFDTNYLWKPLFVVRYFSLLKNYDGQICIAYMYSYKLNYSPSWLHLTE